MSYEGSTFYRQVGGAQSEWFTAAGGGEGVVVGVYSGGSSVDGGIASSLHSSRRQWREWKETNGNCVRQKESSGRRCILFFLLLFFFYLLYQKVFLWMGVDFTNGGSYSRRRVLFRNRSTA